jgi:prepilin-type N-terminal cleavage/methylation domain-containing protein
MNLRRLHFQPSAFTLVEVAISLAIIGIALVAIIGVLPLGMNVQRDNREGTIINQDATVFIEAIRNGSRGLDDLTNYVYAITNYWTLYKTDGSVQNSGVNSYSYASVNVTVSPPSPFCSGSLTNGANIIGLLSTPEFIANIPNLPFTNYPAVPGLVFVAQRYGNTFTCFSNHVVAYARSQSGPAVEKPPQDNPIIQSDAFTYFIYSVNAPVAADTNVFNAYSQQFAANLHELRLTFFWPVQPNGRIGTGRQTYRALIGGQNVLINYFGQALYFYQPQNFNYAP